MIGNNITCTGSPFCLSVSEVPGMPLGPTACRRQPLAPDPRRSTPPGCCGQCLFQPCPDTNKVKPQRRLKYYKYIFKIRQYEKNVNISIGDDFLKQTDTQTLHNDNKDKKVKMINLSCLVEEKALRRKLDEEA